MKVRIYTDDYLPKTFYLLEHDYFDKLIEKVDPKADVCFVINEDEIEDWLLNEFDITYSKELEIIINIDEIKFAELLLKMDGYYPKDVK